MTTEIQAEANRRNALQSTGPKTGEGVEAARFNALRHGLRALQTVVPGEAPEQWEAHRIGVVEDLKPEGAVEGPGRTDRRETLEALSSGDTMSNSQRFPEEPKHLQDKDLCVHYFAKKSPSWYAPSIRP